MSGEEWFGFAATIFGALFVAMILFAFSTLP